MKLSIEDLARAVALSCQGALAPCERDALLEILAERQVALAQQAQPDYRCVMCNKPLPVGCKDCTEYAYDAVGYPAAAAEPEDALADTIWKALVAPGWTNLEEAAKQVAAALRAVSQPTTREQIADAIVKLALRGTSEAKP